MSNQSLGLTRRLVRSLALAGVLQVASFQTAAADNSTSCTNAVQAQLVEGTYSAVETYEGSGDYDYYRVHIPSAGLFAARLLLVDGARYLRPRFQFNSLSDASCIPLSSPALSSSVKEVDLVAEVSTPGYYYVVVTGSGTSRAAGEKYRLIVTFSTAHSPVWVRDFAPSRTEMASLGNSLTTFLGSPGELLFSPLEDLQSGTWYTGVTVAGTGVIIAAINNPSAARVSFSQDYNSPPWSVSIGRGYSARAAFIVDGSFNSDFGLKATIYSPYPIPENLTISLSWIPLCGLREFTEMGSRGCPNREMSGQLPESARLKMREGGRLVTTFEVNATGSGPVKIVTGNSDFDPWIDVWSLTGEYRVGWDQDDGEGSEAWMIHSLPPGKYAVQVRPQSGYGSGYTTVSVDQDESFFSYPDEYPDPPGDNAPTYCSLGAPVLAPGEIVAGKFDTQDDVDAFRIVKPEGAGFLSVLPIGYPLNIELVDLYSGTDLISARDVTFPFGILKSFESSSSHELCIVITTGERREPYFLEYRWEPAAFRTTEVASSAACAVPSRAMLDPTIRDTADCWTAWRAYIGRKRASARLAAERAIFLEKINSSDDLPPELAAANAMVRDIFSIIDLNGARGSQEALLLYATAVVPKEVVGRLSDTRVQEYWFNLSSCLFDILEATTTYYTKGPLTVVQTAGCPVALLAGAVTDVWLTERLTDLRLDFEQAVVEWYFLNEWFSLASLPAMSLRYGGKTGAELVKAVADARGLVGTTLFETASDRNARFQESFDEIAKFAAQDVVPRVEAHLDN